MKIKINWKKALITVGVILAVAMVIGAITGLFGKADSKSISSSAFSVGGLDPTTGEYKVDDQSIYTKVAFECIGLRVEPDFESTVTYDVYYYDGDDNLLDTMMGLSGVYNEDFPLAQYARIVIHPEIPEDEDEDEWSIGFFDVKKYADMLNITVDKKQDYKYSESINLYAESATTADKNLQSTTSDIDINNLVESTTTKVFLTDIDTEFEKYDVYVYFLTEETAFAQVAICGTDGHIISGVDEDIYEYTNPYNYEKPIWVKMTVEVPKEAEGGKLAVALPSGSNCYIFGY